ncbi:hypothetical protein HXA34_19015 [Salipaludibacillus agaradhaerens]|uniref:hypothetical protein n=1 Tax=Salipaludibacillus agaradhaerens TaxID=76935 RepID=UPI002150BA9F|nr:hypothetical protein [Salipaludibacillus agaradhaerens]MCR6108394.1 hypothetical protein [Salipaludibacillus agaradhaerens]MCR6120417.1 hypothetical protein [Salipaludibacillus agaradhaerens]
MKMLKIVLVLIALSVLTTSVYSFLSEQPVPFWVFPLIGAMLIVLIIISLKSKTSKP